MPQSGPHGLPHAQAGVSACIGQEPGPHQRVSPPALPRNSTLGRVLHGTGRHSPRVLRLPAAPVFSGRPAFHLAVLLTAGHYGKAWCC